MELLTQIDSTSPVPRHRQVYDAIRTAILSGSMRPGDRLPPTRVLADQLSLSRTTITEAYDQLQVEGYLHAKLGSGTYVAANLPGDGGNPPGLHSEPTALLRTVQLSSWGERVVRGDFRDLVRPAENARFHFDFRPHQISTDYFPWDAWRAAVDRALWGDRSRLSAYPPSAGHPDLLQAIAEHVQKHRAVRCTPHQIVVVNGTQQGINLISQILLDAGDRVAVEDPGYPTARMAFQSRDLDVRRIPVDDEGLIVDKLRRGGSFRLIHVTPSHQDPTGATLSLGRRLALLDAAEGMGAFVLEDDYDSEFRYEGRPVESLQGLDNHGLVIYAGTFSKSVLPGLRIGFLILPSHLVTPFLAAKALWDGGTPMIEQAALHQFMRSGDFERHIRRMRRLYRARRDSLVRHLVQIFGKRVTVGKRHGGLNVLVSLQVDLSEEEITARAALHSVGLRPASGYFAHPPLHPTFLMGFAGVDEEEIEGGLAILGRVLT